MIASFREIWYTILYALKSERVKPVKILIVSDSHRDSTYLRLAVKKERPDAIVHLGDHASDADFIDMEHPIMPLCRVKGNCDYFEQRYPEKWVFTWDGVTILATHGHKQGVKSGLLQLKYAALEAGAQLVLYGHTHRACCGEQDGLWFLNPGACGGRTPTYGIAELNEGRISCRIIDMFMEEEV